jgi:ribosome biogenesis GTPase
MAKRRLSRRQSWRVRKAQEERLARLQRSGQRAEALLQGGHLGAEEEGLVIANHGPNLRLEDAHGRRFHAVARQHLELPVAGDRVVWRRAGEAQGVAVALVPRRSLLGRPDAAGRIRPLAANIDQIVVVTAPEPVLSADLIDRYLVVAETLHIHPVLLVNKADLLDARGEQVLRERLALYPRLGYRLLFASTRSAHGMDALVEQLAGHTSVLLGQSGVGKSSLVNHLLPGVEAAVGALTAGQGRHTTSATTLYHLPHGGHLIDSPGVRGLELWHLPAEALAHGFVEIRPLLGSCRFRDCRHRSEPGCALRQAAREARIDPRRLDSLLRLLDASEASRGRCPPSEGA